MELYEILGIYRKRAKLKQVEVAQRLGVTGGTYAAIEQGKTSLTIDRVFELVNVFGEEFAMVLMAYFQTKLLKSLAIDEYKDLTLTKEMEKEMRKGSLDVDNFMLISKKGEIELMKKAFES
jgi:transcriptional regulator with XRE-family HTH domain